MADTQNKQDGVTGTVTTGQASPTFKSFLENAPCDSCTKTDRQDT